MVRPNGMATHFDKARRVRSFDDVVEQLREAIYSGRIRPGERLPGERQLSEEFGVGRPTLREALRSLEAVGIIEVRPGKSRRLLRRDAVGVDRRRRAGGARAPARGLARGPDRVPRRLRGRERRLGRAPRRRARPVRARGARRGGARGGRGLADVAELDVRWHETLARATKNRLRIGIALGIHEAVLRRHRATIPAHERSRSIPDEIDAITRAVAAGDPDGARRLMRAHIEGWMREPVTRTVLTGP